MENYLVGVVISIGVFSLNQILKELSRRKLQDTELHFEYEQSNTNK